MADNRRDQNFVTVGSGVSSADSITPTMLRVDPVTEYLLVHVSPDSLTPVVATKNRRDENERPTMYGISSVDDTTLVPIRTDSSGILLVEFP